MNKIEIHGKGGIGKSTSNPGGILIGINSGLGDNSEVRMCIPLQNNRS